MQTKKHKAKIGQFSDSPMETITEVGREVLSEIGTESVNALWDQILGNYSAEGDQLSHGGELTEGQEIDLSAKKAKKSEHENAYIEAAIDYRQEIMHGEKRISREQEQQLAYQIQEIVAELQRLVNSSQALESQFKDVAVIQMPATKPGKYHANFFTWVLNVVRSARIQVEDSAAWLSMFKSKKGQKQYWSMFKKHGTSFGMSNERSVATQVG